VPTSTVENYLKQIYLAQQDAGGQLVSMGRLAAAMQVVPGTATTMIKALADSGLVTYEPRSGVRLTPGGEQLALHVLRRHRLVELFLVKVVGLDWSEVHAEAEELEHAISDKVLERIDVLLGHPQVDPHGDPIPSPAGAVIHRPLAPLAEAPLNTPLRVARVIDQDANFLQFVERVGLAPGTPLRVIAIDRQADHVVADVLDRPAVTLGRSAAVKILVESV
jgi:DtxR family Mn-dependent transcriptional regulator